MTLRYITYSPSENLPLEIHFLPSQEGAACVLHDVFHGWSHDKVNENQANQSIQWIFASLFFPQDDHKIIAMQGHHMPINCHFLAMNLKKGGQFKSAPALLPQINHIDYILWLVACQRASKQYGEVKEIICYG